MIFFKSPFRIFRTDPFKKVEMILQRLTEYTVEYILALTVGRLFEVIKIVSDKFIAKPD